MAKHKINHFKERGQKWGYSIVDGNVRVEINLDRFCKQYDTAQWWLGEQVLQGCRACMPLRTGGLQQRAETEEDKKNDKHLSDLSRSEDGGRRVVFPGPYARFLYKGRVMVGEESQSPWARKGERKEVTERKLTYSRSEATSHWFDTAKANNGEAWIAGVKKIAGGGKSP